MLKYCCELIWRFPPSVQTTGVSALVALAAFVGLPAHPEEPALRLDSIVPQTGPFLGGTPIELRGDFSLSSNTGPLPAEWQVLFSSGGDPNPAEDPVAIILNQDNATISAITPATSSPGLYGVRIRATFSDQEALSNPLPFEMVNEGETETLALMRTLRDNFDAADKNRDGFLSVTEARVVVPALDDDTFKALDLDGNELISPPELEELIHRALAAVVLRDFPKLDGNLDGVLFLNEFLRSSLLNREDWDWTNLNQDDAVTPLEVHRALDETDLVCTAELQTAAAALLGDFDLFDGNDSGGVDLQELRRRACAGANDILYGSLSLSSASGITLSGLRAIAAAWLFSRESSVPMEVDFTQARLLLPGLHLLGFRQLDTDGDGLYELMEATASLARGVLDGFETADRSVNARIELDEFSSYLPFGTQALFNVLDTDHSNYLDADELRALAGEPVTPKPRCGCNGCEKSDGPLDWRKILGDLLLIGLAFGGLSSWSLRHRR